MIKCGKCHDRHETIQQVKNCYAGVSAIATITRPTHTEPEITEKQHAYVVSLADSRDITKLVFTKELLSQVLHNESNARNGLKWSHYVTRYDASRLIDELLNCPKIKPSGAPNADKVPDGRYAVNIDGKLRFFRFNRKTHSGMLRITEQAGPAHHPKKFIEYRKVIDAVLTVGVENAGLRYAQEIGRCWKCGLALTDEESRARGTGPVCATK